MTVLDVAHLLKMSRWTVQRLIYTGELDAIQVGRNWRISVASYRDFLNRYTVTPTTRRAAP